MILKNHSVNREKYHLGGVGGVRFPKRPNRRHFDQPEPPKQSDLSKELERVLHMKPGEEKHFRLGQFFQTNPVKGFDSATKTVLAVYFGTRNAKELKKHGNLLIQSVFNPRTRTAIYLELGRSNLSGLRGTMAREASNKLFALDHEARF